jgi:hypothetical protein
MALGTMTLTRGVGSSPGPVYADLISFDGDGAYSSGGTTGFTDLVSAILGQTRTILGVVGQDCGGYVPVFLPGTDALMVYEQTDTATSPLIETATANLSGTVFNLLVLSK